jgi:hypothetical protein
METSVSARFDCRGDRGGQRADFPLALGQVIAGALATILRPS